MSKHQEKNAQNIETTSKTLKNREKRQIILKKRQNS